MKSKSAQWVDEVFSPVREINRSMGRTLTDLPNFVSPGSREIAQVTAVRAAQAATYLPTMKALETLSQLEDWSHGFMVATEDRKFDWRNAPLKRYESFADFYNQELADTWGRWDELFGNYRKVVKGELSIDKALELIPLSRNGTNRYTSRLGNAKPRSADGLTADYILARLDRDQHTKLAAAVRSGAKSANAAAIEAGFRKRAFSIPDDPEKAAKALLRRWGPTGCTQLISSLHELMQ